MQFRIYVADRETGEESQIQISATTVQDARGQANAAGYLVSSIEPIAVVQSAKRVGAPPVSGASATEFTPPTANSPDLYVVLGMAVGGILGVPIGYRLGGPLGIIVGGICGMLAGAGVFAASAPQSKRNKLGTGGRIALAGTTSGMAIALFFGFCIVPLNWWNGLWSSSPRASEQRPYKWEPMPTDAPHRSKVDWSDRSAEEQKFLNRMRETAREEYREKGKSTAEADREFDDTIDKMERATKK